MTAGRRPLVAMAPGWLGILLIATLASAVGCGRAESTSSVASGVRTSSPQPTPPPNPTASAYAFLPGDCTYPTAGGTPTQPVHDTFQTAVSVPAGWTLQDTSQTDSDFLMTAPATYLHLPTTLSISAPLPTDQGQTAGSFLARITQGVSVGNDPLVVTASPQACTVANDSAAFLSFSAGSTVGYMVLWLHFGDAYLLQLRGNGGVDQKAVLDAKGVLASVTYTHNVPPPPLSSPTATG